MSDPKYPSVAVLRARQSIRLLATPKAPEPPQPFNHSRWPFTYAADHVRSRVSDVDSRAEASAYIGRLAEQAGLDENFVKQMLATAFCRENNIAMPGDQGYLP